MTKSESIPIEEPEPELTPGAIPSRIGEALRAQGTEKAQTQTSQFSPDFKKVTGGWDTHNGFIAESINSFDEDLRTSKMGQSVEIVLESFGLKSNRAEVCIVISSVHFAMLKAKKAFGGNKK